MVVVNEEGRKGLKLGKDEEERQCLISKRRRRRKCTSYFSVLKCETMKNVEKHLSIRRRLERADN